ncbi:Aste57867_916 [Aphanomyces stellatus]|uniref:Aste57867_916 protein n=1 Tax=Aphanomyces stellatus TaxID=120398 RepID=A0A485K8X7_9STRA|nr:hypothetical protein As57867_000915 [Aphanomyces stellatus]VFT78140.1 Aste57867_916 [Aphanomyces stellatus]
MKLPLPSNFFQCPPLTADESDRLKQQAHATAMDVVRKALLRPTATVTWSLMTDDTNGLKIFRGTDIDERDPHVKMCVGVAEVAGSIDEVVDLFRNDTTERAKAYVARFGKGLLDSANLYTLTSPTHEHPNDSVGITWMALKSPVQGIVMPRDTCYLEGQFDFEIDGKRGWVRALRSVDLMCCPDMQHALGLVRMQQLGAGHVFLESDRPGYMRIAYVVHSAFNVSGLLQGAASDWAIDKAIKRRCASLLDMDSFLRENRLAQGHFLRPDQVVPHDTRHHCHLCQKKFGLFVSKSGCMKCGEVFCSACNRLWTVRVCSIPTKIHACTRCALAPPTASKALLSDDDETRSHASSSTSRKQSSAAASVASQGSDAMRTMAQPIHIQLRTPPSSSSSVSRPPPSSSVRAPKLQQPLSTRRASQPLPPQTPQYVPHGKNEAWIQAFIASNSFLAVETPNKATQPKQEFVNHQASGGMILSPTQWEPIQRMKFQEVDKVPPPTGRRDPEDEHEVDEWQPHLRFGPA